MSIKNFFASAVLASLFALGHYAQPAAAGSKAYRELIRLNSEYDAALVAGDAVVLDRLYADDFVYTTFDGTMRSKAQQLDFTRSGILKLSSGASDNVRIRVYGKTAVMTGRFRARGTFDGKPLEVNERYTAVWIKMKGRWRLVAEQGNEIKAKSDR